MNNSKTIMSDEIKELLKEGYSNFEVVSIVSERWKEKTFVVSYILELIEKENEEYEE